MKTRKTFSAKAKQIFRIFLKKTWLFVVYIVSGVFLTAAFVGAMLLLGLAAVSQWVWSFYEDRFPEPNDYNEDGDY